MDLHLGLSLSTHNNPITNTNKKRCFEDYAFEKLNKNTSNLHTNLSLLSWNRYPNDDDDDHEENKRIPCNDNGEVEDENEYDEHVVGWPPIKSWRRKALHHQQGGRSVACGGGGGGGGGGKMNNNTSNYVKVKMEGVAISRKVNLRLFDSYQSLTSSLINMFAKSQLAEKDSIIGNNYILTYLDKDGDWLLAGDLPWQTFIGSVQRLELLRNEG